MSHFRCLYLYACLLAVLFVVIVLLYRRRRSSARFPDFSVTISKVGREEAYVTYCGNNRQIEFSAEIRRGRQLFTPRIFVQVPKDMPDEDVRNIIPNLASGLAKLRYEYLVFRKGEPQTIPEEERQAAIAELRRMGCEIKEPVDQGKVQRAVMNTWPHSPAELDKAMISKVQGLMSKARGVRESIEVLTRSDFD